MSMSRCGVYDSFIGVEVQRGAEVALKDTALFVRVYEGSVPFSAFFFSRALKKSWWAKVEKDGCVIQKPLYGTLVGFLIGAVLWLLGLGMMDHKSWYFLLPLFCGGLVFCAGHGIDRLTIALKRRLAATPRRAVLPSYSLFESQIRQKKRDRWVLVGSGFTVLLAVCVLGYFLFQLYAFHDLLSEKTIQSQF